MSLVCGHTRSRPLNMKHDFYDICLSDDNSIFIKQEIFSHLIMYLLVESGILGHKYPISHHRQHALRQHRLQSSTKHHQRRGHIHDGSHG